MCYAGKCEHELTGAVRSSAHPRQIHSNVMSFIQDQIISTELYAQVRGTFSELQYSCLAGVKSLECSNLNESFLLSFGF